MTDSERDVVPFLGHGWVRLVGVFGSDEDIEAAARTSYAKGTRSVSDRRALIRYLVRHEHLSPLEMAEVKFILRVPLFVVQQLLRHRTANVNQESLRYSEAEETFYVPEREAVGVQSRTNRQGRDLETMDVQRRDEVRALIDEANRAAYATYRRLLDEYGVARELARVVLPVSCFTTLVWKSDLRNFLHFCRLRMAAGAQYEIRRMATVMYEMVRPKFPLTCEAWEDYEYRGERMSAAEMAAIRRAIAGGLTDAIDGDRGMSSREQREFLEKLGIPPAHD